MSIFIWRNNEEIGPFSRSEVFTCLLRGELTNDDHARAEIDEEWRPLRDVLQATVPASGSVDGVPEATAPSDPPERIPASELSREFIEARGFDETPANQAVALPADALEESGETRGILIWRDDGVLGPYSQEEVFAALFRREITAEDRACREGDEDWSTLSEILYAGAGMLISPAGETSVIPEPFEVSEETEDEAFQPVTEAFSKRPLLDLLNARSIFAIGVIGMIVAFGATFLLFKEKANSVTGILARNIVSNAGTSKSIASRTTYKQTAASISTDGTADPQMKGYLSTPKTTSSSTDPQIQDASAPPSLLGGNKQSVTAAMYVPAVASNPTPLSISALRADQDVVTTSTVPSLTVPDKFSRPATPSPLMAHRTPTPTLSGSDPKTIASAKPSPALPALVRPREITLPKVDEIDSASLWVADTVQQPRAVLVLCLETGARPHDAAADRAWQTFAHENQLALAAISFASNAKVLAAGRGYYLADRGAGDLLLSGLERATKNQHLPIILYGRAGGAVFATSFASWKPDRLVMWAAYTGSWLIQPQREKTSIPALIACDRASLKDGMPVGKFYASGRALGKPWTLLPLVGHPEECQQQFDEFFRRYLPAVLSVPSPAEKSGVWADVKSSQTLTSLELMVNPARAAWLPSPEVRQQWADVIHRTHATDLPIIVERDEPTRNPKQPSLHLYLRLPPGAKDGRSVSGVLAYCTWQNTDAALVGRLNVDSHSNDLVSSLIKFAEDHNLAILTWGTVATWDNSKDAEEVDRRAQEQFDKNFELLADAWARGVAGLGRDTGIPQKDFLLYGISRGAQWAQKMALSKPDYFLAVHVHIPSTFSKPVPEANKILWLLTTGELEFGYGGAQRFYHESLAFGYPIIFKAIVGLGHSDSPVEHALGVKFFEYALSVKATREAWETAENDPLTKMKAKVGPSGAWLEAFRTPAFYGDFLNQECYPAREVDMIPVAFRVPLPTKELADLWNK